MAHTKQNKAPTVAELVRSRLTRLTLTVGLVIFLIYKFRVIMADASHADWTLLVASCLYLLASDAWLSIETKLDIKRAFYDKLSSIDAFVIGFAGSYFAHSGLVCLLLLGLVIFNGLIHGGWRQAICDSAGFAIAIILVFAFYSTPWLWSSDLTSLSILLVTAVVYLASYAWSIYNNLNNYINISEKAHQDQIRYKLRTYKLARYLTPTVWRAVVEGREKELRTERKRVTVFFSDITGFSALSEELEAETLTDLLNTYLTEMTKIASKHEGTIDKFMGDGIMIIFGDAQSQGVKNDCVRALSMAIDMRRKMKELENHWYAQGIEKPLKIRMGLNTGYCTVGSFGTSHYMDYTVLGTHVNLASRLESAAEPGEILISYETWSQVKDVIMCRDKGEIRVKGFSNPIKVYQVVDFRKDLGKNQSYFQEHAEGFSMHLDLDKIRNYDRDKIVEQLHKAAEKLNDKVIG